MLLLVFVERESAVRSCGDGPGCVSGAEMDHTAKRPREVAAPHRLLGTWGVALLVYPVQAETSEQRDQGKGEKDFWTATEMIGEAAMHAF